MIAENDVCLSVLEELHDLVGEAVLIDAVAEADQLVDLAHQVQRLLQSCNIAVDIGHDSQFHFCLPIDARLAPRRYPPKDEFFFRRIYRTLSPSG